MAVTAATFRGHYPEFQDIVRYPDLQVAYWISVAVLLLDAIRWGTVLDLGTELYVAHNIALEAKAQLTATNGGIPGGDVGAVNSKSVDKVSVGYDTSLAKEEGGGHWNLTIYGVRFFRLAKFRGTGPIQLGVGYYSGNGAWSGPYPFPTPNG